MHGLFALRRSFEWKPSFSELYLIPHSHVDLSFLTPQPGHHCRLLALVPLPQVPQDGERGLEGGEKKKDINALQFEIYCKSVGGDITY